jgi:hypothetical protein
MTDLQIDDYTRRGHEHFRRTTKFTCGDGKQRTFSQWLEWMKTWDPMGAEDMRERGPGISRRPRPSRP